MDLLAWEVFLLPASGRSEGRMVSLGAKSALCVCVCVCVFLCVCVCVCVCKCDKRDRYVLQLYKYFSLNKCFTFLFSFSEG